MSLTLTTSVPPAGLRGPGKRVTGKRLESGRYRITVAAHTGLSVTADFACAHQAWDAVPEMWAALQREPEPKGEAA